MVSAVSNIGAKSALFALRSSDQEDAGNRFGIVRGGDRRGFGQGANNFFNVTGTIRTENSVFRTLGESLGNARGAVNTARAGTNSLGALLDDAEKIVTAVEAGTAGSVFSTNLSRLETSAAAVIDGASNRGTNLLQEGEALNVTIGFDARGGDFNFRELSFQAVGLAPTGDARNAPQVITETITETVEVDVTREERIQERIERLNTRVERLDARETRLEARIERITERQGALTERVDRLTERSSDLNQRLEDVGARPENRRDQRRLERAIRLADRADQRAESGNTRQAERLDSRADALAERAGLTISLDQLNRLENRLERVDNRVVQTQDRITSLEDRKTALNDRITQTVERREATSERITRLEDRLLSLSEEQLNRVVATRTETVEREVERTVESPTAGSFEDLFGTLSERIKAGDTEGAREIIGEARDRLGAVDDQLDTITGALNRRGSFFGALTDRLDSTIRSQVEDLSDDDAARRAAIAIAESEKINRLFSGSDVKPGILELFQTEPAAQEAGVETDRVDAAEEEDA